jgi:ELWxxDGT repeat protein
MRLASPPTVNRLRLTAAISAALALVAIVGVSAQAHGISPRSKTRDPGSVPSWMTGVGGTLYFSARDGVHGWELWKSDGTAAETSLVRDVNPGPEDSFPSSLTNVEGTLFFRAGTRFHTSDLWKSDGTALGTVLVRGPGGPQASSWLTSVAGTLFFTARDPTHGDELWKSDGTVGGTALVRDINPGSSDSEPFLLTDLDGTLMFAAYDPIHGSQLWKSDGTQAGTVVVKIINKEGAIFPDYPWVYTSSFTVVDQTLYFPAANKQGVELWRSDGTSGGIVLVKDIRRGRLSSNPIPFTGLNGTLLLAAHDRDHGTELWRSDGTAAGTVVVKDINPGRASSFPGPSDVVLNGTLYFTADDGVHGAELWSTDGTAAGTTLVKDIRPGPAGSSPAGLTIVNGALCFFARDGVHGYELWRSDGTAEGTHLVKDIRPGPRGSFHQEFPGQVALAADTMFFAANDGVHGMELWKSDGTAAGTVLVEDINLGSSHS